MMEGKENVEASFKTRSNMKEPKVPTYSEVLYIVK